MRPSRLLALILSALALGAVAFVGCGGDDEPWEDQTLAVGSLFSTTGAGITFGPQQVKGAQLAVEEVNEDSDLNGGELVYTQRDDASDPATSAEEMASLIDSQEVLAVLGPTFSNSAAEADPIANQKGTPVLAVSNTGPGIVGDCAYDCDFIFRDSLGEATAIPANIETFVAQENPRAAKVIYPKGDPFGRTSAETAVAAFEQAGVSVKVLPVASDGSVGSMNDDRTDVFMITASSGEAASTIVKDLRAMEGDFEEYTPILGGNAFNSPLVAKSLGTIGEGVQSASAWFAGNTSEENQEFIAAYQAKYGEAPDQFAAQAYTGVKLLAEAFEDADLKFEDLAADRKALRASLEKVNDETPLGQFSFTPDHDVVQPIWIVAMDGKGGYELVEQVDPA